MKTFRKIAPNLLILALGLANIAVFVWLLPPEGRMILLAVFVGWVVSVRRERRCSCQR